MVTEIISVLIICNVFLMCFFGTSFLNDLIPPPKAFGASPVHPYGFASLHTDAFRSKENGRNRHSYCHRPAERTCPDTAFLKPDFARRCTELVEGRHDRRNLCQPCRSFLVPKDRAFLAEYRDLRQPALF